MKRFITYGSAILAFMLTSMTWVNDTQATVIVDPLVGRSGLFFFTTLGPVDSIDSIPGNDFSITVPTNSVLDLSLDDCCIPGDEFDVHLDGSLLTPDTSNPGSNPALFFADYLGIPLSTGTHTLELFLTAACCSSGGASYAISAATPVADPVPEPGTWALMGTGLVGMLGYGWRRRKEVA